MARDGSIAHRRNASDSKWKPSTTCVRRQKKRRDAVDGFVQRSSLLDPNTLDGKGDEKTSTRVVACRERSLSDPTDKRRAPISYNVARNRSKKWAVVIQKASLFVLLHKEHSYLETRTNKNDGWLETRSTTIFWSLLILSPWKLDEKQAAHPMIDPLNMGCQKETFATSAHDGTSRVIHNEYAHLCKCGKRCESKGRSWKREA